jgi:hypothetical protein
VRDKIKEDDAAVGGLVTMFSRKIELFVYLKSKNRVGGHLKVSLKATSAKLENLVRSPNKGHIFSTGPLTFSWSMNFVALKRRLA